MTADKPTPVVPNLRFLEFAQGPGWDHATVADLVETVTPPKKLTTSTYLADGRFPIIDQSQSYICGWTNDDEAVISRPLPVIVFGDHTCVLKFVNRPFAQGADGIKILMARRRVSTLYLYHQLTYRPVVMEEYKRHFSALKHKVVCFPDPKSGEQQKIADCLGSLDDLIATEGRKLEALRQHKQGLMQQLFPQPGATVPRLRFPEFRNAVEWRKKKLGDLSVVKASGDLDVAHFSSLPSTTHPYPVYSNAVENAGLYGYYSLPQYKKNSVTITARGTLGVALLRDQEFMGIGRLIVVSNLRNLDPCFLKECWNHLAVIPREVTSIPQLTAIAVRATVLPIPEPAEQKKIADCLGSLEDVLAAQARKLNTLKAHKQGLLQQLFPTLETA